MVMQRICYLLLIVSCVEKLGKKLKYNSSDQETANCCKNGNYSHIFHTGPNFLQFYTLKIRRSTNFV